MKWISELCDHSAMESVPVVKMPDVHAGSLCDVKHCLSGDDICQPRPCWR